MYTACSAHLVLHSTFVARQELSVQGTGPGFGKFVRLLQIFIHQMMHKRFPFRCYSLVKEKLRIKFGQRWAFYGCGMGNERIKVVLVIVHRFTDTKFLKLLVQQFLFLAKHLVPLLLFNRLYFFSKVVYLRYSAKEKQWLTTIFLHVWGKCGEIQVKTKS